MASSTRRSLLCSLALALVVACSSAGGAVEQVGATAQAIGAAAATATPFAGIDAPIAGVAATRDIVFVGSPLDGSVLVLSRASGAIVGSVPPPPEGFALPFILHIIGDGKLAILGAGGLPAPAPFVPANPFLYEYDFSYSASTGFAATLVRDASFASALIGFSEDFVRLEDGRYLVSDSVLGAIWVLETDGSVVPGIAPLTLDPSNLIPQLAFCPTMPELTVNGYPFLFTGSTLPGVSPIAVRDGTVYYYSPCARGIYAFPLRVLDDARQPYQRAASIRLVASTPASVQVEELLDFTFNPYDADDPHLYAADPLAMAVIRVDVHTGARQVLASGAQLFDFPSSLAFAPPKDGVSRLFVVSNQQERSPLTNDAVSANTFNLPFVVAELTFR